MPRAPVGISHLRAAVYWVKIVKKFKSKTSGIKMKKDQEKSTVDEKAAPRRGSKKKRPWEKPQLIVLYRARPEEYVLVACKGPGNTPAGPGFTKLCHKGALWCSERAPT